MLFSDRDNFIGRHLNKDVFCVTDSFQEANAFAAREKGGVLVVRNEETIELDNELKAFQENPTDIVLASQLGMRMDELIGQINSKWSVPWQINDGVLKPDTLGFAYPLDAIEGFGWNDPPHVDIFHIVALMYGHARPVEIASCRLLPVYAYSPDHLADRPDKAQKISAQWDRFRPISFCMPGALIGLMTTHPYGGVGPMHRVPQQLNSDETRPLILSKRYGG